MMYMAAMMGQTGCKLIMVNSAWDGEGGGEEKIRYKFVFCREVALFVQ